MNKFTESVKKIIREETNERVLNAKLNDLKVEFLEVAERNSRLSIYIDNEHTDILLSLNSIIIKELVKIIIETPRGENWLSGLYWDGKENV